MAGMQRAWNPTGRVLLSTSCSRRLMCDTFLPASTEEPTLENCGGSELRPSVVSSVI